MFTTLWKSILASMTVANLVTATVVFAVFMLVLFLGSLWLPGREEQGMPQPDGSRLTYKLNGLLLMILVLVALGIGTFAWGWSLSWLARNFWPMFVVVNLFSIALTLILTIQQPTSQHGIIGALWYGTQLNPIWFGVEIKIFSYRPSLIGLALFNLSFLYLQYEQHQTITAAMWAYQGLTLFYLLSSFQYEHGMLSMWDIIEEKFGFMLIWGDYVVVPFFYCIPAFFLVDPTHALPLWMVILLCVTCVFGFWMFRGANSQKHQFKQDPSKPIWGKTPETVGGRLLISGWWGIGRKLNYTGEILMYLSWTMLAGFHAFWPYLLPLWLVSLLLHRAWRDDQRCRAKYGPLWEEYCQKARFKMIPFLY